VRVAVYYAGRFLQVLGMWLLAVDLFTAGPQGPSAQLFVVGIGVFVAGWWLAKMGVKR
jgi:hypothetical protein